MEEETLSQKFAALLTGLYAEQQTAAAEKCGVSGGESWRVAFESASNSGARQVCMPDGCCSVLCRRLLVLANHIGMANCTNALLEVQNTVAFTGICQVHTAHNLIPCCL